MQILGNLQEAVEWYYSKTELQNEDIKKLFGAMGKQSIALANGYEAKAKAALGGYIVVTEFDDGNLINCKCHKVDGKTIKPDTYYMLKNGRFVKAEDEVFNNN